VYIFSEYMSAFSSTPWAYSPFFTAKGYEHAMFTFFTHSSRAAMSEDAAV